MNRRGGGFGLVMLVVVLAVVLLLVARSWKSVGPEALDVSNSSKSDSPLPFDDHGQTEAGEALRDSQMPGLHEMRQQTDDHARQVQDALTAIE